MVPNLAVDVKVSVTAKRRPIRHTRSDLMISGKDGHNARLTTLWYRAGPIDGGIVGRT
jgi:hypothetical protein